MKIKANPNMQISFDTYIYIYIYIYDRYVLIFNENKNARKNKHVTSDLTFDSRAREMSPLSSFTQTTTPDIYLTMECALITMQIIS